MKLRSLSASSAKVYELCPARWSAEYENRLPTESGSAANLGTVCHEALERYVAQGFWVMPPDQRRLAMKAGYDRAYWDLFHDRERYDEGLELVLRWMERTDLRGREVLSTETKQTIPLVTSAGEVPFNFIMDRLDDTGDGIFEVTDYKTGVWRLWPDDLKSLIQPRAYAWAVHEMYPEAQRIWVVFDQLRYDPIGIVFTAEECKATGEYLHALAERILADEERAEIINPECRFCSRKNVCKAFQRRATSGMGDLRGAEIEEIVARRHELASVKKGIEQALKEADEAIVAHLRAHDLKELRANGLVAGFQRGRAWRTADVERLLDVFDLETLLPHLKVDMKGLDALTKDSNLDSETASVVKQATRTNYGKSSLTVRPAKDDEG